MVQDWNLDNGDFQLLTRMKQKCYSERPKRFAELNNSEALERTLKDVIPKSMQNSDQWALWALTLCAGEWITEHNKHCSKKCLRVILETEDAGRLATVTAYYRTAQEKG